MLELNLELVRRGGAAFRGGGQEGGEARIFGWGLVLERYGLVGDEEVVVVLAPTHAFYFIGEWAGDRGDAANSGVPGGLQRQPLSTIGRIGAVQV